MDNLTQIILIAVVAILLLGCTCKCSGVEGFGRNKAARRTIRRAFMIADRRAKKAARLNLKRRKKAARLNLKRRRKATSSNLNRRKKATSSNLKKIILFLIQDTKKKLVVIKNICSVVVIKVSIWIRYRNLVDLSV